MDWHDILTAFALCLVMEGIIPFANPVRFKRIMVAMVKLNDSTLRIIGAASMAVGLVLLYLAR